MIWRFKPAHDEGSGIGQCSPDSAAEPPAVPANKSPLPMKLALPTSLKPGYLIGACLSVMVVLPVVSVASLYAGQTAERARFAAYADSATILQILQDAEVDFALARRSSQAFLRSFDPAERTAVAELIATSRKKIADARAARPTPAVAADIGSLDGQFAGYIDASTRLFDLAVRRQQLQTGRLRFLGEQIATEIGEYGTRWRRGGLDGVAAGIARARAAIVDPESDVFGPADLTADVEQPLALAATAEMAQTEATALVRRIEARVTAFAEAWRELIAVNAAIAELLGSDVVGRGRAISNRFETLTDALQNEQRELFAASQREAAHWDRTIWAVVLATAVAAAGGAGAAWRLFAAQRRRARAERERRIALENALAKLDAALRGARTDDKPPVSTPTPVSQAGAAPDVPKPPAAEVRRPPQAQSPAPAPAPVPAKPAAADPTNDELIAMLMNALPQVPPPGKK